MPAMTNILVKDDAATPKTWTLIPVTDTPDPIWRSSDANIPIEGQVKLTESVVKLKNGGYKISVKLEVPVMETLGASGTSAGYVAPPKVAYVNPCILTMFVDKRSTNADRANVLRMMIGLAQGATSVVDTGTLANNALGGVWGSNQSPITLSFTQLLLPN